MLSKIQKCFPGLEWEYSATSHGKKVVAGIGGTAESRVYTKVIERRATVQHVIDFVIAKVVSNITVISVLQNSMNKTHIDLNLGKNVPRVKKAHIVKSSDNYICLSTCQQNLDTPMQELCCIEK